MESRAIQITAMVTAIPLFLLICKHDLWAEPKPDKINPAFYVFISEKAAEPEITLEVETMTEGFDKQIDLLCRCVEAESGNQSVLGKRLVCDVILNRVSSEAFPDGIEDVINQPGQFGVVSNGSIGKAVPSEETITAVLTELNGRIDTEIIYFQAGSYPAYGTPAYQVDAHYFSK